MVKIPGRNEPCWCGSGIKYKKCHLNKKDLSPDIWGADKALRKDFSRKTCLIPKEHKIPCDGVIVKAHTIPKSGSLTQISRNGHVYGYRPSVIEIKKAHGVPFHPQLIGIN